MRNMSWKSSQASLGLILVFSIYIQTGFSLKCWECNSEYDRRCKDPFTNSTFQLTDCVQKLVTIELRPQNFTCRKIIQKVKGETRYIRKCGYLAESKDARTCYRKAGTFDVQIEYCHCDSDACNDATSLNRHAMAIGIVLITAILIVRQLNIVILNV